MTSAADIHLAAVGDSENPATWSGIPYHFLRAARDEGMAIKGLRFNVDAAKSPLRKLTWAASRFARGRAPRGMQYSESFLRDLWDTTATPAPGSILLNCAQLFPSSIAASSRYSRAFFLDQTLDQLFDYYGHGARVAPDIRKDAMRRERVQYNESAAVILQSRWAARSVLDTYGIHPAKVHVILPGANLDPQALAKWDAKQVHPRLERSGPLRIGFVGKDWQRKGLDRLIRAVGIARARGSDIEVQVVGLDPATLPAALREADGIRWLGFIDKRHAPERFLEILDGFDIGSLLSLKEAGGISLLEFARLGIPTLAPNTGGAPEYVVPGASTLIAPDADDARIADLIASLAGDAALFADQRAKAWDARLSADWRRCAREIRQVFSRVQL